MKSLEVFASFLIGAAIGSSITFIVLKEKYDKKMEEEFNKMVQDFKNPSVQNFYSTTNNIEQKKEPERKADSGFKEYSRLANIYSHSEPDDEDDIVINDLTGDPNALPVIIPPDEFGDDETYAQISLLYYSDGVLADERDHPFRSYDSIPNDFEEHFGEYEDDAVYARNDRLRIYYEILRSEKTYAEVIRTRPYLTKEDDDA